MQKRITQLIGNISNENIIGDLLRINDDLNNSFVRYERFEKTFQPVNDNHKSESLNKNTMPTKKSEDKPLIDFDADETNGDFMPNGFKPSFLEKSVAGPPLPPMNRKTEMPDDDDDANINQVCFGFVFLSIKIFMFMQNRLKLLSDFKSKHKQSLLIHFK